MISLQDFQKFESLKQEIKTFLIQRCYDFIEVKGWNDTHIDEFIEDWEIRESTIDVFFDKGQTFWYSLPIDIVFDPDFKTKFKKRVDEEKRLELIRLADAEKRHYEAKRLEKIEMLRGLMREFPDVVKEGV